MARKSLSAYEERIQHFEAVTLTLRSRSFSHKSRYFSRLMRYRDPVWWFGKPEERYTLVLIGPFDLDLSVKVKFSSKNLTFLDFRILIVILAVYLLGIVPTGEHCWLNVSFTHQDHFVTFKFRKKFIRDFQKSAFHIAVATDSAFTRWRQFIRHCNN